MNKSSGCRMISSTFSLYILLLSIFVNVSTSPTDDAKSTLSNHNLSQNLNIPYSKKQAQKLHKPLGLSHRLDQANIVEQYPSPNAARIVERRIRLSLISDRETTTGPGPDVREFGHYAGFFRIDRTKSTDSLFYFFFETRQKKKTAPVVVWLNGGPGCSSLVGLFRENGPFKVTENLSLVWNDYGWDQEANMIFLDQPIGTGFSNYTKKNDIPTTSEEAAVHLYDFLQAFFKKHPMLSKNDFYITGESYAGHYIPAIAARINDQNKRKQGLHINLLGIAIGNGWTNSGVQTASFRDYAFNMKLINMSQYKKLTKPVKNCLKEVNNVCTNGTHFNFKACAKANKHCDVILDTIMKLHPHLNRYDIRKNLTTGPSRSLMERFLNRASVKRALGVDVHKSYYTCSDAVYDAMKGDMMRNLAIYIPGLLEDGIKLLLYVGEYDIICNWLGNWQWVHEMKWTGQTSFNKSACKPFMVNNTDAGSQKSFRSLTFLKVYNAGHMVPLYQPKAALEMLSRWMNGLSPL